MQLYSCLNSQPKMYNINIVFVTHFFLYLYFFSLLPASLQVPPYFHNRLQSSRRVKSKHHFIPDIKLVLINRVILVRPPHMIASSVVGDVVSLRV